MKLARLSAANTAFISFIRLTSHHTYLFRAVLRWWDCRLNENLISERRWCVWWFVHVDFVMTVRVTRIAAIQSTVFTIIRVSRQWRKNRWRAAHFSTLNTSLLHSRSLEPFSGCAHTTFPITVHLLWGGCGFSITRKYTAQQRNTTSSQNSIFHANFVAWLCVKSSLLRFNLWRWDQSTQLKVIYFNFHVRRVSSSFRSALRRRAECAVVGRVRMGKIAHFPFSIHLARAQHRHCTATTLIKSHFVLSRRACKHSRRTISHWKSFSLLSEDARAPVARSRSSPPTIFLSVFCSLSSDVILFISSTPAHCSAARWGVRTFFFQFYKRYIHWKIHKKLRERVGVKKWILIFSYFFFKLHF